MLKKEAIGVWLIEPKTAIDYLAINLHIGNRISKGEWTSVINMHKEISEDHIGLPRRVRRKKGQLKY